MTWEVQTVAHNPMQNRIALINVDREATITTDYHKADKLARETLGPVTLAHRGYTMLGRPMRIYVSQNY